MKVEVNCKSRMEIDIDCEEAFKLLVKTLHMDFILDEDYEDCFTVSTEDGTHVYCTINGKDKEIDDRGELYRALTSVAKCIFTGC